MIQWLRLGMALTVAALAPAATPDQVLVVLNRRSPVSREIAQYYLHRRGVPDGNVCLIGTAPAEEITRGVYAKEVEAPIAACLKSRGLSERVLYIVLTKGVPLRVAGGGEGLGSEGASVDSELTLLYQRMRGREIPLAGPVANPFFGKSHAAFGHPLFPMYLVTRLDGYDAGQVKAMIDRGMRARNVGTFAIDLKARETNPGNEWLRTAARRLPKERVALEESAAVLENVKNVIGYASWGSNDTDRHQRFAHLEWLPGGIATEFVSTDGRTFQKPPEGWTPGGAWDDKSRLFAGTPQSLTADFIHEGASGASGQVYEPFLQYCARPDLVLPAYAAGRNLAESFWLGIPALSWMNVVVGDPLMRLE